MWNLELERELWADVCLKSFWWFCVVAMGLPSFPKAKRWFHEYMQRPLCDWFQEHIEDWLFHREDEQPHQKCLIVLLPREFAKTTIITQAGQLWLHLRDPNMCTATGSEDTILAQKIFSTIKVVLSGEDQNCWFTWLYGNWYTKDRKWRDEFAVHAARTNTARSDPSFTTWGVATGLTGYHPDAFFFDDPISYERLASDGQWLTKLDDHIASLGSVIKADGLVVWIGTRYGSNDHIGKALRRDKLATVTGMAMDAIATDPSGRWHVYYMKSRSGDNITGPPTFPEQWPDWRLKQAFLENPQKYSAQQQNDPMSSEFNPITAAQIDEAIVDEQHIPYNLLWYYMLTDTAFKRIGRQGKGDENVIILVGNHIGTGNVYYIEGYSSKLWRAEDFYSEVVRLIQKYQTLRRRIVTIAEEQAIGRDGAMELALRSRCNELGITCPHIETLSRTGDRKWDRIVDAANYIANGFAKFRRDAPGFQQLKDQLTHINDIQVGGGLDDFMDAYADAFHKKIYQPMRKVGVDGGPPELRRPWDDVLRPKLKTVTELYDEQHAREESPYNPI